MNQFDREIDRRNTDSTKWNKYAGRDVLPFWVADMDFPAPDFILDAIRTRLDHGILGYANTPQALTDAFLDWCMRRFEWHVDPDWLVWLPGVVPGMNLASRAVGEPGDGTIVPTPVYHPFLAMPRHGDKTMLTSRLQISDGRWIMDFDDIADKARRASSLLLSNPQNPTGRVYTRDELLQLAEICLANDVVIISDEIHWGIVLDEDIHHIPIASLSPAIADRSITFLAPTKTYNLAGVSSAVAVIPDPFLRDRLQRVKMGLISNTSPLAYAAAIAAYQDRTSWLPDLLEYLRGNRDLLEESVARIPGLHMTHVEGTYLAWIDARSWKVGNPGAFLEAHGLGFSDGADFQGDGFMRMNFACPRSILSTGIERLRRAAASAARES